MGAMPLTAAPAGALSVGGDSSANAAMSPLSDAERLLPKSLFGSDPASTTSRASMVASETVSPQYRPRADPKAGMRFGGDDRWVCIPSGIVERYKSQFEGAADGGDCGTDDLSLPPMPGSHTETEGTMESSAN